VTSGGNSTIGTTGGTYNGIHVCDNTFAVTSGTLTVSAPLIARPGFGNSAGGFTKTGAGSMILAADNAFGGNVVVSNGLLQVGDTLAGRLGLPHKTFDEARFASPQALLQPANTLAGGLGVSPKTLGQARFRGSDEPLENRSLLLTGGGKLGIRLGQLTPQFGGRMVGVRQRVLACLQARSHAAFELLHFGAEAGHSGLFAAHRKRRFGAAR